MLLGVKAPEVCGGCSGKTLDPVADSGLLMSDAGTLEDVFFTAFPFAGAGVGAGVGTLEDVFFTLLDAGVCAVVVDVVAGVGTLEDVFFTLLGAGVGAGVGTLEAVPFTVFPFEAAFLAAADAADVVLFGGTGCAGTAGKNVVIGLGGMLTPKKRRVTW